MSAVELLFARATRRPSGCRGVRGVRCPAFGSLDCVRGCDLELGDQLLEASGVVEPGLVAGELRLAEQASHGFAVDGSGPLDVGAMEGGRVGFALAARLPAAHVAHDHAAWQRPVELRHGFGEPSAGGAPCSGRLGSSHSVASCWCRDHPRRPALQRKRCRRRRDAGADPRRTRGHPTGCDRDRFAASREHFEELVGS